MWHRRVKKAGERIVDYVGGKHRESTLQAGDTHLFNKYIEWRRNQVQKNQKKWSKCLTFAFVA